MGRNTEEKKPTVVIIVENSSVPRDVRVWSEATSLKDAGWRVIIICPDTSKKISKIVEENLEGITVFKFPLYFADSGSTAYLREYLTAFVSIAGLCCQVWYTYKFKVIHICNPPDIFFLITAFFRMLGVKVIFDHHDLFPELVQIHSKGLIGKAMYWFARLSEILTMTTANVVLSTNDSYRRIALNRGRKNKDSVFIVRNGPKNNEFTPVEPDFTLREGFTYMACYVGVMGKQDGVVELIDVIYHIVKKMGRNDILFTFLGSGSMRLTVEEKVRNLELQKNVRMLGFIHDKLLIRKYLCSSDVCLAPELLNPLNEFSTFIKIGEYMAMGKPVVAYDLIETRYTAEKSAIYVPSGNIKAFAEAVVYLLDSPEKRHVMGNFATVRVSQTLCWEKQAKNLINAYEAVCPEYDIYKENNGGIY
jgi:glycosyltransferase involved in cell wall biosynthesis